MAVLRRMYVSVVGDSHLSPAQIELKWAVIEAIASAGYVPEVFYSERPQSGALAYGRNWSFAECSAVMARCVGAVIIGLPRHQMATDNGPIRLPTEYAHIEGTFAFEQQVPTFVLVESGLSSRGLFFPGGSHLITTFPFEADAGWTKTQNFVNAMAAFLAKVHERRDVFLGYCSTSAGTARNLKRFIEKEVGASVLDWQADFIEGRTIIEEIEEAARRTTGGIFLFTRDDALATIAEEDAPRDNVVFEAGFFAHAKGRRHVLIVRENGAKMPADLGGSIYAVLADKTNITPLEPRIRRFLETSL